MSMSERKAYTGKYGIDTDSHNNYISKHFFFKVHFMQKSFLLNSQKREWCVGWMSHNHWRVDES